MRKSFSVKTGTTIGVVGESGCGKSVLCKAILKLLQDCSRKRGMTVVIITHNQALTAMADRIIKVKSGKIASVKMNEQIVPVEEIEW